jgi:hypothetical protein
MSAKKGDSSSPKFILPWLGWAMMELSCLEYQVLLPLISILLFGSCSLRGVISMPALLGDKTVAAYGWMDECGDFTACCMGLA